MPFSSKEFLDIQATIECRFTLRRVRDMITTSSQEYCFIRILLYIMSSFWSFLILRLEVKRMDMFFSLSKWPISLLSTNQSHMFAKSSFNFFLISLAFLFWKTRHLSTAYKNRSLSSFKFTVNLRLDIILNRFSSMIRKPIMLNFFKIMSWLIVSNAFGGRSKLS